jgi:hypothetical protein
MISIAATGREEARPPLLPNRVPLVVPGAGKDRAKIILTFAGYRTIFLFVSIRKGRVARRVRCRGPGAVAAGEGVTHLCARRLKSHGSGELAARHKGLSWRLRLERVPTQVRRSREGPPAEDSLVSPPGIMRRKAEHHRVRDAGVRFGFRGDDNSSALSLTRADGRGNRKFPASPPPFRVAFWPVLQRSTGRIVLPGMGAQRLLA